MNEKNNYIRDYCGVTAWHRAGYTGSRVCIGSSENFETGNDHARHTYLAALEFAPDARYVYAPMYKSSTDPAKAKARIGGFLAEHEITAHFSSLGLSHWEGLDEILDDFPEATVFVSAGNDAEESSIAMMRCWNVYGVGAVALSWSSTTNGEPAPGAKLIVRPASYSSVSEHVDFCAPTNVCMPNGWWFTGTSCACPALAGMCALINDFFIDKTGKPLSREMMYQFLVDHSEDLQTEGHDAKTGWGLVRLPDPESVDIQKYQPDYAGAEEENEMESKTERTVGNSGPWSDEGCAWAVDTGLYIGDGQGHYNWTDPMTREEMAVVLHRFYKLFVEKGD